MQRVMIILWIGAACGAVTFAAGADRLIETQPAGRNAAAGEAAVESGARFAYLDVWIDSGQNPLAAYQFELAAEVGDVRIVGIEGGDGPIYADPPYYDNRAMQHDQVILAAFSTAGADALPRGNVRVARIHVMIEGDEAPEYVLKLHAAARTDGEPIEADLKIEKGSSQ